MAATDSPPPAGPGSDAGPKRPADRRRFAGPALRPGGAPAAGERRRRLVGRFRDRARGGGVIPWRPTGSGHTSRRTNAAMVVRRSHPGAGCRHRRAHLDDRSLLSRRAIHLTPSPEGLALVHHRRCPGGSRRAKRSAVERLPGDGGACPGAPRPHPPHPPKDDVGRAAGGTLGDRGRGRSLAARGARSARRRSGGWQGHARTVARPAAVLRARARHRTGRGHSGSAAVRPASAETQPYRDVCLRSIGRERRGRCGLVSGAWREGKPRDLRGFLSPWLTPGTCWS